VRAALKRLLERVFLHGGPAALSRVRVRGQGLILAYHNVVADDDAGVGDASLHLPLSAFHAQLAALEEYVEVVPLPTLLEEPRAARKRPKPRVAISFDDAYHGTVTVGLPELARRGMPATVFVCPGRLGGEKFWWDRYAWAISDDPDSRFRDAALHHHGGAEERISAAARARGWSESDLPDSFSPAHEKDLAEAARLPGVLVASHSWSHPNLANLEGDELRTELVRSREWLAERFENSLRWLSYPYGIVNERVASAAADAGYEAALRVEGGWLTDGLDKFMLPRLNVPAGLSNTGFRCRLSGLFAGGHR